MKTLNSLAVLLFVLLLPVHLQAQQKLPFMIVPAGSWGTEGHGPGEFLRPRSISADPAGYLYLCDTGNHRIQKYDLYGRYISQAGGFGWGEQQFDTPVAITSRNGLDIFAADYHNRRIKRYDKDLNYISAFSLSWSADSEPGIEYPSFIDVSPLGDLYCLDGVNLEAVKITNQGLPVLRFGGIGSGEGRFKRPAGLHISRDSAVFIPDVSEQVVKCYDMHGNFLFNAGAGILKKPSAVTSFQENYLFVADEISGKIHVFNRKGGYCGDLDPVFGGLKISDMTIYKSFLIILDSKNNRVSVFSLKDTKGSDY